MEQENPKQKQVIKRRGRARGGHGGGQRDDWLGKRLRELYAGYSSDPLPDELRALLDRLGRGEEGAAKDRK